MRTLVNLSHRPLGFRSDHMLLFQLNPPRARYSDAQMKELYRQLEGELAAIPGVRSTTMSNIAIIGDGHSGSTFHVSGQPVREKEDRVQTNAVGSDFFQTIGIPVLQGRIFNARDTASAPKVALVNRALAQQYFPNRDPIGQTFTCDSEDVDGPVQIVGLVADTRYADLRSDTPPTFYVPYQQRSRASRMVVEMRTAGDPGSVLMQVRAAVESLDRDLPLIDVRTMSEQIDDTLAAERVLAQLTGSFGLLALVLASIGIYGIMAYTVSRRVNEIGIRMAMGAPRRRVLLMILGEVSGLAGVGIAVGLGGALLVVPSLRSMLFDLSPADPFTLIGATSLLFGIAVLAGWGPAHRASVIQPMQAIRHE